MSEAEISPDPGAAAAPAGAAQRRVWRWLGFGLAGVVLLAALAVALVFWAVHSARGSAWLLTLVPRLEATAPEGALLGDFAAERIVISLPGTSGVLRLDALRWNGLVARRGDHGRWLHLSIDALHAGRVSLLSSDKAATPSSEPSSPPASLRLPVEIEIGAMSVDELRFGAGDDAPTLRAVRGRIHLGDDGGAQHRFDTLAANHERADATGQATIAADAPFAVDAKLDLASVNTALAWRASASAEGPLEALNLAATVRVAPSGVRPAQSLDARALVQPFAAWPLGELHASTSSLDLSAFTNAAPATALSGQATLTTSGIDRPAIVSLELRNERAGRWNEGLLPVRQLRAELRGRPDEPSSLDVQTLFADLGSASLDGGRVAASGRWTAHRWTIALELDNVRAAVLDARAPETSLAGQASLIGTGFAAAPPEARALEILADVSGPLVDRRQPHAALRLARLRLEAHLTERDIDLRSAEVRLGQASATATAHLTRPSEIAPWRVVGRGVLADFDPAPWWPGAADSLFSRGTNRLNAKSSFDLVLPASPRAGVLEWLTAMRGKATLSLTDSALAGVPLEGEAAFANTDGEAQPSVDLLAAGNRIRVQGHIALSGPHDSWQASIDAPELARLSTLLRPPGAPASSPVLTGNLAATARIEGRWPEITSEGEMHGAALGYGTFHVGRAEGRWHLGSAAEAVLDGSLSLDDVAAAGRSVERVRARLTGTAHAHRAQLRVDSQALPPEWVGAFAAYGTASSGAPGTARAASASIASGAQQPVGRSSLALDIEGGLVDLGGARAAGWNGTVHELLAQSTTAQGPTWLRAHDLQGSLFWSGGAPRVSIAPGSAEVLGATVRWSRFAWQAGTQGGAGTAIDMQASVDPVPIAPMLRALQPDFGWGGDLAVGARIEVHSEAAIRVDLLVERARGDLTVTDEYGTQDLGVDDLRFDIASKGSVWTFTAALAGSALGNASGSVTAETPSSDVWPDVTTPIKGKLDLRIANLGAWGRWLPAGWRLGGEALASASIGGRFGAPEYTGRIEGSNLGVRNFLQGVDVTDGRLAVGLEGSSARIEAFSAKGGSGTIEGTGSATFGAEPAAHLEISADKFELLGRVDRRLVVSGKAALRLGVKSLDLDGDMRIDEGLIDFTRSDAPSLGDDVAVVRRPVLAAAGASAATAPAQASTTPRQVALDLRVAMGEKLRVRGRGLDAGLRGDLHLTSPGGPLVVNGTLRAEDGTYQAYAQKLGIDRGVITFVGPIENPRLDIEATRPNLDVRVGVVVSGTALSPRIRLFSDPDMTDIDKLSWLLLGRASEGVGSNDTALLQTAALALLSGEGPGVTDRLTHAIGLDAISVRQESEGDVKATIVSLGKQISKRWYIGYERGLNATTGSWQLIYRLAQRFTVRAQAGGDNSLDLIWTLRWK